MTSPTKTYQLF